jgi:hypothetical protein
MNDSLHDAVMAVHIAAGLVALLAGAAAVAVSKGGAWHGRAGTGFFGAMLVLGITASILEPYRSPPGSPIGGIMVCYFVGTSWVPRAVGTERPAGSRS